MRSRHVAICGVAAFILLFASVAIAAPIPNGSFEDDSVWTAVSSGGMLTAGFSTQWSSDGSRSYRIERLTGAVTAGSYMGIQQNLDLTGVGAFFFDAQDQGIDTDPLQFLIDGIVVGQWSNNGWPGGQGSGWGHTAQTYNISIPLAATYTGVHTLTIRYWIQASHFPADPKIYWIDNLHTDAAGVPEPATAALLVPAATGFLVLRKISRRAKSRA